MRRRVVMLTIAVGLVALGPALGGGLAHAQDKPRIAVVAFKNPTGWWGRELGASAASQLTTKLVNSGAFNVLERDRVKDILDEWYLGQTGAVAQVSAAPTGQLKGVEYLVTGEFKNFNINQKGGGTRIPGTRFNVGGGVTTATSSLNVRVISVTTGEVLAASESNGSKRIGESVRAGSTNYSSITQNSPWNPTVAEEALGEAIDKIASDLIAASSKMPTTGAPAPASAKAPSIVGAGQNGALYIDQGQNTGMTVGRRFVAMRVVDVIKDANGKELDKITNKVGVIEVTQVLAQSSICKIIEGKPAQGDTLQPN